MSQEEIVQILQEARKVGAEHFHITGGEPLMRKDLPAIIREGHELGYFVELLSNGLLLSKKRIKQLKESGMNSVGISLDGNYEMMHAIRGVTPKQYNNVINAIRGCVDENIRTKVNTVVFPENLSSLEEHIKNVSNLTVAEHRIYYFSPMGSGLGKEIVPPEKWYKFVTTRLSKIPHQNRLFVEFAFDEDTKFGCRASKQGDYAQVMCNGDVFPCAIMTVFGPIGNARDEPFDTIWNDSGRWEQYCSGFSNIEVCPEYTTLEAPKGLFPSCPCTKVEL